MNKKLKKQITTEHRAAKKLVSQPKANEKVTRPMQAQTQQNVGKKIFLVWFLALGSLFGLLTVLSLTVINYTNNKTLTQVLAGYSAEEADVISGDDLNSLLAFNIDPKTNYQGAFLQARAFFEEQQYQKAVQVYEQIVAVNGSDPEVLENYSYALLSAGNLDQAKANMSRAIELTKDQSKNKILKAKLYDMGAD